jgi:hypothetical protein
VLEGVTPQVQFVKAVSDELVELMGSEGSKDLEPGQPQVILMAGLQVRAGTPPLFPGECGNRVRPRWRRGRGKEAGVDWIWDSHKFYQCMDCR